MDNDPERKISRSWDANASAWTRAVREEQIESRRLVTDGAVIEAVLSRRPSRVLDVGCGEGWLARCLSAQGIDVLGIDGSQELIERAKELGGSDFQVLSYERLAEDPERVDGLFDGIVCNFALLGQDLSLLLRALREKLTDRGSLFIQTVHPFSVADDHPYADGWRTEDFAAFGGAFPEAMPWYFRTFGSWIGVLHDAGFTVVECREPFHPVTMRPLSLLLVSH